MFNMRNLFGITLSAIFYIAPIVSAFSNEIFLYVYPIGNMD